MRGIYALFILCIALLLTTCRSAPDRVVTDSWGDASLVAKQQLIIEQQQQRFDDMGDVLTEIHGNIDGAITAITSGLDGNASLEEQFREIDLFVRRIIESKRALEELLGANWGEDAGAR
jgi:hypothetical protein